LKAIKKGKQTSSCNLRVVEWTVIRIDYTSSNPDKTSLYSRFLQDAFIKVWKRHSKFIFVAAINHESCRGSELRPRPIVVSYRIVGSIPAIDLVRIKQESRIVFSRHKLILSFLSPPRYITKWHEAWPMNNEVNRACVKDR